MTPFQWISLLLLSSLLVTEFIVYCRRPSRRSLVRSLIWLVALVSILNPAFLQRLAAILGIGRAADLVLYTFVLLFLATSFYLYARCMNLERQITVVTRHIAKKEARRGQIEGSGRE